ncbi:hypothetical protein GGR56DRAFT_354987 [Xylariaceae sp. FL0804]|nr:hypothetical protein GGR56DRAFT_354987 [Xylariaceae sp. FL0804]
MVISPRRPIPSILMSRTPPINTRSPRPGAAHGHPPSPATTPPDLPYEVEIHGYSSDFLNLYKDDRDVFFVQTNSFANLIISNVLSSWLRDHAKLREETGWDFEEVFQSPPPNIETTQVVPRLESKKLPIGPDIVHWQYLKSPEAIDKDVPLIELKGQIGIQKNYCEDPENRWQDLTSPLPFVFFHPMLPIYIDTRKEGSNARYVRRSCKPNAQLDTFLLDGSQYRFWLVSDRQIAANEQITLPWDFRLQKEFARRWLQLLGLGDETDGLPDFNEKELDTYNTIANWVYNVLSEHGGCACDLGPECAFARFHRTYISRPQGKERGTKQKKSRKAKVTNISPTSTGHATNSRAPSEGHGDDGADNDSGSSRSKPPSRDMTPAPRQGSFDTLGVLTELTDRDKRKVQMVEDSFRRMEQQQPPRKKKRTSDGAAPASTAKTKSKNSSNNAGSGNNASDRRYVDAGTSGRLSISPTSGVSPSTTNPPKSHGRHNSVPIPSRHSSQGPRPEYRDASVQTDPVDGEWFSCIRQTPRVKKRVVSLSKRLLGNRHRIRADGEMRRSTVTASPTSVASALLKMDLDSPTTAQSGDTASPDADKEAGKSSLVRIDSSMDTPMADAPMLSPTDTRASPVGVVATATSMKTKSPQLRVQLPPVPAFNNSSAPSVATPLSATGSTVQSPFSANNLSSPFVPSAVNGVAVNPSPVKKKLSLSDYTKSRMNKAAGAKPATTSLKPPTAIMEEAKSPSSVADSVMLDSPATEKSVNS